VTRGAAVLREHLTSMHEISNDLLSVLRERAAIEEGYAKSLHKLHDKAKRLTDKLSPYACMHFMCIVAFLLCSDVDSHASLPIRIVCMLMTQIVNIGRLVQHGAA
jgi:hypothetical protein